MKTESVPETNNLVVTEYYQIPQFWQRSEDEVDSVAVFHAREFLSLFRSPATTLRSMPIGLLHPQYITHRITVDLPESWNIAPQEGRIENDALVYTDAVAYARN